MKNRICKKVLFTATVVKKHINEFHLPYLRWFHDQGYEVWVAAKNDFDNPRDCMIPYCDHYVDIPFSRNPFSKDNIQAFKKLKKLIDDNNFTLIHTHTPVGSVITRLASKHSRRLGTKVIYTAHGFHFYNGANWKNWLVYYPVEKYFSRYLDCLITINKEDYERAKDSFYCETRLVNGIGFSFEGRKDCPEFELSSVGISEQEPILTMVAELNREKNQKVIMDAMSLLKKEGLTVQFLMVGDGKMKTEYQAYAERNGIAEQTHLLGYRKDVFSILKKTDIFVFPSLREGMPVSLMEAMYCGLPCIVNDTRGNRDLIDNDRGGYICQNDPGEYAKAIKKMLHSDTTAFGEYNRKKVDSFSIQRVLPQVTEIYKQYLQD